VKIVIIAGIAKIAIVFAFPITAITRFFVIPVILAIMAIFSSRIPSWL